ncbi:hypothetical protein [Lysobacter gummosus]|uniref:hypothetical protein n=1 Tax=Lysobacter gummosus TaxID=262324 RepID=UPI00364282AB
MLQANGGADQHFLLSNSIAARPGHCACRAGSATARISIAGLSNSMRRSAAPFCGASEMLKPAVGTVGGNSKPAIIEYTKPRHARFRARKAEGVLASGFRPIRRRRAEPSRSHRPPSPHWECVSCDS